MRFIAVILLMLICGCKANVPIYNIESLPQEQLAYLKAEKVSLFEAKLIASIHSVYDINGIRVIQSEAWQPAMQEIWLQPGRYLFIILCANDSVYAYPRVAYEVEKDASYEFSCIAYTEKGFLGIKLNKAVSARIVELEKIQKQ